MKCVFRAHAAEKIRRLREVYSMRVIMLGKGNPRQCTKWTPEAGKWYASVVFIESPPFALGFRSFEVMIPCYYNNHV